MMEERRRYKRFDTVGTVVLKPEDGTSRAVRADLINIGFTGITTVYVQEKIEVGIYVKLEYDSNVFRMGIEFIDIDKKAIQNILNLIQANILAEVRKRHSKMNPPINKKSWL